MRYGDRSLSQKKTKIILYATYLSNGKYDYRTLIIIFSERISHLYEIKNVDTEKKSF